MGCVQKGKDNRWLWTCGWSGFVSVEVEIEYMGVVQAREKERVEETGVEIVVR